MGFLIWIIVGGVVGWLASLVMRTDAQQGLFLNIVVGIVGALLGGWLISPLLGVGTINESPLSIGAIVVSLIGAIILLAPHVARSPDVRALVAQVYLAGWFALVLGGAFVLRWGLLRWRRRGG